MNVNMILSHKITHKLLFSNDLNKSFISEEIISYWIYSADNLKNSLNWQNKNARVRAKLM